MKLSRRLHFGTGAQFARGGRGVGRRRDGRLICRSPRTGALTFLTALVGCSGQMTAYAQGMGSQPAGLAADLSGVYVAVYSGEPATAIEPDVYPLTAAAERAYNAFDPLVADPRVIDDCAAETLPIVLWSANPMEIIQEDGRILMHFEEGNTTRSISMDGAPPPADQPHTELGYSVGQWAGGVLTIETTHLLGGLIIHELGYPISRDARMTERYWREPADNSLRMELLIDDPVNYTEPLEFARMWGRSADDRVRPWECVNLGPRDTAPPDIDELARILEEL